MEGVGWLDVQVLDHLLCANASEGQGQHEIPLTHLQKHLAGERAEGHSDCLLKASPCIIPSPETRIFTLHALHVQQTQPQAEKRPAVSVCPTTAADLGVAGRDGDQV